MDLVLREEVGRGLCLQNLGDLGVNFLQQWDSPRVARTTPAVDSGPYAAAHQALKHARRSVGAKYGEHGPGTQIIGL